jgi:hypothetical protein
MSSWQGSARSLVRRLVAERTLVLAGATAILVVIGAIATIADSYGLTLLCVLALQATIAGYLLTSPDGRGTSTGDARGDAQAVDRASARTLADLAHTRQSILDAIAELETAQRRATEPHHDAPPTDALPTNAP